MKYLILFLFIGLTALGQAQEGENKRAANTIVLDSQSVKNLNIALAEVEEQNFEETIFTLGRIQHVPQKRAILSSRVAGRITQLRAFEGDSVKKGQKLARIESLLPGDPPPTISLVAPLSGIVLRNKMSLGQPVSPEEEILEIVNLSEVWVVARVPEEELQRMKVGTRARIKVIAESGTIYEGKLIRFGTYADAVGGTLDAIFQIKNDALRLKPGMRAEISIVVSSRPDVMTIPRKALQGDDTNRHVYVEDFDLKYAYIKTSVVTGKTNDQRVEILSGLFPGDRVVTTGSYLLSSATGGSVSLKEALDAAHGHEHSEDGSEKSDAEGAEYHEYHENSTNGRKFSHLTVLLAASTAILAVLLILSGVKGRRKKQAPAEHTSSYQKSKDTDDSAGKIEKEISEEHSNHNQEEV